MNNAKNRIRKRRSMPNWVIYRQLKLEQRANAAAEDLVNVFERLNKIEFAQKKLKEIKK